MSTFIGALLDGSYSMRDRIGDGVDEEGGTWARSIIQVMDDLVKHDVSKTNHVFTVGFGASCANSIFDPIGTIQEVQKYQSQQKNRQQGNEGIDIDTAIDRSLEILERNGANKVKHWAGIEEIKRELTVDDARLILNKLESHESFVSKFVEILPRACKLGYQPNDTPNLLAMLTFLLNPLNLLTVAVEPITQRASAVGGHFRPATPEEVHEVITKVKEALPLVERQIIKGLMKGVDEESIFSVQKASDIIHGSVDEKELTRERARELLKMVDPYIYCGTPFYEALGVATSIFTESMSTFPNHHRLMFVLSDGEATDEGKLYLIQSQLRDAKVTVVGCYIDKSSAVDPRRLHSVAGARWEKGAKFLFNMSSTISTELVPRAIFIKQGWTIDITNNETKLFMHVNHPDHLKDACNLARNAVCCQDTLCDLLVSVDLDIYINQKNSRIEAHDQVGGTCYANASAAVLHLAMHRIRGRDRGYPDFDKLRDNMIHEYGIDGAYTYGVLKKICPRYRLHCRETDVKGAMEAIAAKRPVVATFRLTDDEWRLFGMFYQNNPKGILRKSVLDISARDRNARTGGHAVVLTSFNSECFRLMNSWGDYWADMGFFRVENSEVLGLKFIDVYWTVHDLSQQEKDYYRQHGSEVTGKLMKSLKALQVATFTCPSCRQPSKVSEFTGTLARAKCPGCSHMFSCNDGDGNILALNMYLSSLIE